MTSPQNPSANNNKKNKWLLSLGTTLLALIVLEVALRVQFSAHRRANGFELDPVLGWKTVANAQLTTNKPGYGQVAFTTEKQGFRRYGELASAKRKILVLGDSYTFADTVNDGEAYFDCLADLLDVEIFAFGCNGYGTLQELMILREHFQTIRPDLVIWQLCDNDFVNNSYELESRDLLQSNFMVRPYRFGSRDVLAFPALSGSSILSHSQLARWSYRRLLVRGRKQFDYSKQENKELGNQAIELTASLLKEGKQYVGDTPMLVFCNRHAGLYVDAVRGMGFHFTSAVEQAIDAAVERGEQIDARPRDLHWNAKGQKIVADALARVVRDQGILTD